MQITITNQALQCVYITANQHREKTQERIFVLDRLFDAIEDIVWEFEVQIKKMKDEGDELTKRSENTALKQEERKKASEEIIELDKNFQAVYYARVAIELQKDVVEMMKDVLTVAIEAEKVAWRRNIKCAAEALFAIDEYLANA